MRKTLLAILAVLFLTQDPQYDWTSAADQTPGVVAITVTNVAANITADAACSKISCLSVVVKENSAAPSAIYSVTPRGTTTAINVAAGQSFEFDAPAAAPFVSGQILGSIVATTSGPFSFVAIESAARTSGANAGTPAGSGGGGTIYGSTTSGNLTYGTGTNTVGNVPGANVNFTGEITLGAVGTGPIYGLSTESTVTDNAGGSVPFMGGLFAEGLLEGTNAATDYVYGIQTLAYNAASAGSAPQEVTSLQIQGATSMTVAPVIQTGEHILDQAASVQAATTNAALLIDDQSPGATVYAIKTGLGQIFFGDGEVISPAGATGLTIHGDAFNDSVFNGFSTSGGGFTMNSSDTGLDGTFSAMQSMATLVDTTGTGTAAIGADFTAGFNGSSTNVTGDSVFGLRVLAESGAPALSGAPAEVTAILVREGTVDNVASVVQTGMHILDQGGSAFQASGVNAALLIDNQTAGATVYSIKTGTGPVSFGGVVETAPTLFADLGTPPNGSILFCSNCDTPITAGVACTSAGDMGGASGMYVRSGWECF